MTSFRDTRAGLRRQKVHRPPRIQRDVAAVQQRPAQMNVMSNDVRGMSEEMLALRTRIVEALANFPEARLAVVEALSGERR